MPALKIAALKTPGLHLVGVVPGLSLQVKPSGAKSWILRAVVGGRRREIGLGGYPGVTLAQAREKARQARENIEQGVDPVQARKAARSALLASQASALTFKACALACIKAMEAGWKNTKHSQQWTNTLDTYAFPLLGRLLVADVTKGHILQVIEPIWLTKNETASRVRGRIEKVLDYAVARGHRPEGLNPARWSGNLDSLLASPRSVQGDSHFPAVQVAEAGAFMASLRASPAASARALEFLMLTAVRSDNVVAAEWTEIDLAVGAWVIPAVKMKGRKGMSQREHRVPLSRDAIKLLKALPTFEDQPLVFPSPTGKTMSDATMSKLMKSFGYLDQDGVRLAVPHGLRSTFRDWAAERTNYPRDLAEMAMAHSIGDKTEAAYRRGDMFEKRRRMMEDWAVFCGKANQKSAVVPISARSAYSSPINR